MTKKRKDLVVSEKHGLNPTIPICFWCGQDKNEVVLLGKLPNDAEAPHRMWLPGDYEPCEKCAENRKLGVDIMEASDVPVIFDKQPPYGDVYPTGRHAIVKKEAVERLFGDNAAKIIEVGGCFVDKDIYEQIFSNEEEK